MSEEDPSRPTKAGERDLPKPTPSDVEATRVFHATQAILPPPCDAADMVEELEEDAIVGQASGAHEPQPLTQVAVEHRRVVISELPLRDTEDPEAAHVHLPAVASVGQLNRGRSRQARRERRISEPTLVMRDRRQLEELRRQLLSDQDGLMRSRAAWMWGAVTVFALASVALTALLLTRRDRPVLGTSPTKGMSTAVTITSDAAEAMGGTRTAVEPRAQDGTLRGPDRDNLADIAPDREAPGGGAPGGGVPGGATRGSTMPDRAGAGRQGDRRDKPVDLKELPLER